MNNWRNSWTAYSVGLLVAWVIVLSLVWKLDTSEQLSSVTLVFYGFFVGWLSATIKVYLMRRNKPTKTG